MYISYSELKYFSSHSSQRRPHPVSLRVKGEKMKEKFSEIPNNYRNVNTVEQINKPPRRNTERERNWERFCSCCWVAKSCPTRCNPMDYSLARLHTCNEIISARILEYRHFLFQGILHPFYQTRVLLLWQVDSSLRYLDTYIDMDIRYWIVLTFHE